MITRYAIKGVKRRGQEYEHIFEPEMCRALGSLDYLIKNTESEYFDSMSKDELTYLLNNEFESAKNELINELTGTPFKIDKLNLLSEIACELKLLRRSIKNIIEENSNKDNFKLLIEYLEKMYNFIKCLQKDIRSISQEKFPILQFNLPNKNASSELKPLQFFEFLFNQNGISQLRNNFIHYYERFDFVDFTYNNKTETIIHNHYDTETGEWKETREDFNIVFSKRLKSEYYISREYIDNYIDAQKEETIVVFFIKKTLKKLTLLLGKIEDNDEALKYKDSAKPINALIQHIHNNYGEFVEIKKAAKKTISEAPKFFKLKGNQATIRNIAIDLHDSLVKNGYLNVECKKDFVNLFTGQKPKDKLTWKGNKGDLKSFINYLLSLNKIEKCNSRKWQITAANFKYPEGEFTAEQMNNSKKIKDDSIIKNIVLKVE